MNFEDKATKALEMLRGRIARLEEIPRRAMMDEDYAAAFEKLKQWKAETVALLTEQVHPGEGQKLKNRVKMSFIVDPLGNLADEANTYRGMLLRIAEEIEKHPERILLGPTAIDTQPSAGTGAMQINAPQPGSAGAVFVIGNSDAASASRLKELLTERWNIEVLALDPGEGEASIERFEAQASRAAFAIAILSANDLAGRDRSEKAWRLHDPMFEIGWFCGRLGRDRVCLLLRDGVEAHLGVAGVERLEFDSFVGEKAAEIELRLKKAGLLG